MEQPQAASRTVAGRAAWSRLVIKFRRAGAVVGSCGGGCSNDGDLPGMPPVRQSHVGLCPQKVEQAHYILQRSVLLEPRCDEKQHGKHIAVINLFNVNE